MRFRVGLMAVLVALAAHGELLAANIVDAAEVAAALKRGAIVWDVRDAGAYAEGHIPRAINIGRAADVLRNPNTENILPLARVQPTLNGGGIDLSKEIIVYSRRGDPDAYWALTLVRHFGGKSSKVFHGGMDEWKAAGQPVSKDAAKLAAIDQKLTIDPLVQIYLLEVRLKVGNPDVQFVDSRTPGEFSGDVIKALRGGHIPGALSIPVEQNWTDPTAFARGKKGDPSAHDGMVLISPEKRKALYSGLDPDKETIVYCQSGVRAAQTAWILSDLGFRNVRVFEESWLGYGNDLSAPAESVQFVNIGALKTQIAGLEADIERLTAGLKVMGSAKDRPRTQSGTEQDRVR